MKKSVVDQLLSDAGLHAREVRNSGLITRVLRIGPAEAKALLVANRDNRPLRKGRVNFYARTMADGGWWLTHQGIAFSADGKGMDLQHRLQAIVESGCTVEMMVVEGLDPRAFEAIDLHERRTMADALKSDRTLVETAKFLILARGGAGSNNPTVLEVGEVTEKVRALHDELMNFCNARCRVYSSVAVKAAAIVLMSEMSKSSRDHILDAYRNLVLMHTENWSPAMHALHRQYRNEQLKTAGHSNRMDLVTRALIALNPNRRQLSKIQITASTVNEARKRITALIGDVDDESGGANDLSAAGAAPTDRTNARHLDAAIGR